MALSFDGTGMSMDATGTPLSIEASSLSVSSGVSCPSLDVTSKVSATSDTLSLSVGSTDDVLTLSSDTCTVSGAITATGSVSAASLDVSSIGTTGVLAIGSAATTSVSISKSLAVTGALTATSLGVTDEYVLPSTDGDDGEVLTTDGEGVVSWVKPLTGATVSAPASGAIQQGDPVVVTSDGTLETVYIPVREGTPLALGAALNALGVPSMATDGSGNTVLVYTEASTFDSYAVVLTQDRATLSKGTRAKFGTMVSKAVVTYDASHDRFVIAWYDGSSPAGTYAINDVGKVVVAKVTDGAITFGDEVIFADMTCPDCVGGQTIVYDSAAEVVVIGFCGNYVGNPSYSFTAPARAVVGTVNPVTNSITLGTELELDGWVSYGELGFFYDPVADKIVVLYVDFDTEMFSGLLLSVSGTTLTAGAAVTYAPSDDSVMLPQMAYDTVNNRIIMTYETSSDRIGFYTPTYKVVVRVARIDGTTLTLGDEVVVNTGSTYTYPRIAYEARGGYGVVIYGDVDNTMATTAITATVSGSSLDTVTLGTPVELAAAASDNYAGVVYSPHSKSLIVSYYDTLDSDSGQAMVYAPSAQNNLDSSV
ncbi:hypothetical protein KIPB_011996, partial [Kipferlia bialata]|eukprot:g11996.t1